MNSKRHIAAKEAAEKAAKAKEKLSYNQKDGPSKEVKKTAYSFAGPAFLFDMEMKHKTFFQFIREKDWDSVEAMFDSKVKLESHMLVCTNFFLRIRLLCTTKKFCTNGRGE